MRVKIGATWELRTRAIFKMRKWSLVWKLVRNAAAQFDAGCRPILLQMLRLSLQAFYESFNSDRTAFNPKNTFENLLIHLRPHSFGTEYANSIWTTSEGWLTDFRELIIPPLCILYDLMSNIKDYLMISSYIV